MKQRKVNATDALRKVALANNTTVEEVRREIMIAMDAAMANPDPAIQTMWRTIPCAGEKPTPEEFIAFVASTVIEENSSDEHSPFARTGFLHCPFIRH